MKQRLRYLARRRSVMKHNRAVRRSYFINLRYASYEKQYNWKHRQMAGWIFQDFGY